MNRRATVRGTARRVVIVPPPEDGPFEQAIFVVKAGSGALSESELLREALAAAAGTEEAAPARTRRPGWRWRLRRALPWILTAASSSGDERKNDEQNVNLMRPSLPGRGKRDIICIKDNSAGSA